MDPDQVRASVHVALLKAYYQERRLHKGGPLPVIEVNVSDICRATFLKDEREVYQCFVRFQGTPRRETDYRLALGNTLMDKISSWKGRMIHKPLMDVTLTQPDGLVLYQMGNVELCPLCMKKATCYYYINQAIMDQLADKLLGAWCSDAFTFVVQFTLHD